MERQWRQTAHFRRICTHFETCDVILTPTTPSVAYSVHENVSNPVKMYQADICTVTVNIATGYFYTVRLQCRRYADQYVDCRKAV
ncbi:MAG: amidase family protein [Ruminococcus sp.]